MCKIPFSIYEAARDVARSLFGTEAYARSRRSRKKVEIQFTHLKRTCASTGCSCGSSHDEFLLAAMAQNLRKLAKFLIRPPPDDRNVRVASA